MKSEAEIIPCELDAVSTVERICSWQGIFAAQSDACSSFEKYMTMNIFFNNNEITLDAKRATVADLLRHTAMPLSGIAVAVNNKVVRKTDWETAVINPGDNVTVITAVCGG